MSQRFYAIDCDLNLNVKNIQQLNLFCNISNSNYQQQQQQHQQPYRRQFAPIQPPPRVPLKTYTVTFNEMEMKFTCILMPLHPDIKLGAVVHECSNDYCRKHIICPSLIVQVNEFIVSNMTFDEVVKIAKAATKPTTITFHECDPIHAIRDENNPNLYHYEWPQTEENEEKKERIIHPKGVRDAFPICQISWGKPQKKICVRRSFSQKVFFEIVIKALTEGDFYSSTAYTYRYAYDKYAVTCSANRKDIKDIGIKQDGEDRIITVLPRVMGGKNGIDYETVVAVTRRAIATNNYTKTKREGYKYIQDGFVLTLAPDQATVLQLEFLPMRKKMIPKSTLNVSARTFTPKTKTKTKTKTQILSPVPEENDFNPATNPSAKNPSTH